MIATTNEVLSFSEKRDQQLISSMEKLFSAAQAKAVFGEPVVSGNYTVITASEVSAAGGFGSGMGFGPTEKQSGEVSQSQKASGGGGVGADGRSRARLPGPEPASCRQYDLAGSSRGDARARRVAR